MGKYLHLFLGDSAKTEHDEMYNNETTYRKPWVAFTQGYGMSFNKKEVGPTPKQDWFKMCDINANDVDWLHVEKIEYDVFPPNDELDYGFLLERNDKLYYNEKFDEWRFYTYNDNTGEYDDTPVESLEQLNQLITESSIMDYIHECDEESWDAQPDWEAMDEFCYLYRIYPMEGYNPIRIKSMAEMTTDDWTSLYGSNSDSYDVYPVVEEEEFFNSLLGGAEYLDFYLTVEFRGQTQTALLTWENDELLAYYDDFEKRHDPDRVGSFSSFLLSIITSKGGMTLYIDNLTASSVKQAIENNFTFRWIVSAERD